MGTARCLPFPIIDCDPLGPPGLGVVKVVSREIGEDEKDGLELGVELLEELSSDPTGSPIIGGESESEKD
jgi:hypothetical protein